MAQRFTETKNSVHLREELCALRGEKIKLSEKQNRLTADERSVATADCERTES
jgi:hypothetical protein